jgi:hypothetical protein
MAVLMSPRSATLLQKFGSCKKSTTDWKIGHTLQSEDFDFPGLSQPLENPLSVPSSLPSTARLEFD